MFFFHLAAQRPVPARGHPIGPALPKRAIDFRPGARKI